jgi:hypothetical protein
MIALIRKWPIALLVLYWCLMAPAVFACDAAVNLTKIAGFVSKGTLGKDDDYIQRVYSGNNMSFSTVVFPPKATFNKEKALQNIAKSMVSAVRARTKNFEPNIKILNQNLLSKLDGRLEFLIYAQYGSEQAVNIEASSVIKNKNCWAILRFTALSKEKKEVALNHFAALIRVTELF